MTKVEVWNLTMMRMKLIRIKINEDHNSDEDDDSEDDSEDDNDEDED